MDKEELQKVVTFELPEWFSLDGYDNAYDYSLHEWSTALELRSAAHSILEHLDDKEISLSIEDRENHFWEFLEIASRKLYSETSRYTRISKNHEHWEMNCRTVSPVSVGSIGYSWDEISKNKKFSAFAENLVDGRPLKSKAEREKFNEAEQTVYDFMHDLSGQDFINYTGCYAHILIELDAPEEVLVEHFKKTIRDYKRILNLPSSPKKITKNDLRNWAEKKILLYIDLMLLAKYHKKRISQQTMGVILFPDDYYVSLDDRVRKTIKPLADKLLSEDFIAALTAQADSTPEKVE